MTEHGRRPRLTAKVRLKPDRFTGRVLLLYPERGLLLNGTAADIATLCTGEHGVADIVRHLADKYRGQAPEVLERETEAFLDELARRGLVEWSPR